MSPRNWHNRVNDILDAIGEIQSFVLNLSFEQFQDDLKTIRAVELNLIIIGEAANGIPEEIQNQHAQIGWHLMCAMRNRLVHTYFSVSPKILWDTIQVDLPPLAKSLQELLPHS